MVLKIGHRGAAGHEPENTLSSLRKALELDVDIIELDVHLSRCGEIVVIHDKKVNRTTNGKGHVSKKTLNELKSMDVGKGERIPTLREVLDLINRKVQVNVELKGKKTAKPVFEIIENYVKEKGWSYDNFIISSFSRRELKEFRKLNPAVRLGVLSSFRMPIGFAEKINAYSLNPSPHAVSKKGVDKAHRKGMKVFVFTADEQGDIKRVKSLGVDGIFSNFPERL